MDSPLRIGIVGSRRRNTLHDRKIVFRLVELLVNRRDWHDRPIIVSGGCPKGADAFAEEAAKVEGLETEIYPIDKTGADTRWEFTKRAFARNRVVAEKSGELYALVAPDRKGGTENTVGHMLELKKPTFLVNDQGEVYLAQEDGSYPQCDPVARLLG